MKISPVLLIFASFVAVSLPTRPGHGATSYYHPRSAYAEKGNQEGVGVSVDIDSGGTTQTYDVPLRRAGLPVKMSLTADEAEEEGDYRIVFQAKRYRLVRGSTTWSMRLAGNLELFLFDAGMEHASSANYLDKRFRFSIIGMHRGAASERECSIVPGRKLGLAKAGAAVPDSLNAVVERIAQRVASGQLSAKDYRCAPARAIPAIDASRFDGHRQRSLEPISKR